MVQRMSLWPFCCKALSVSNANNISRPISGYLCSTIVPSKSTAITLLFSPIRPSISQILNGFDLQIVPQFIHPWYSRAHLEGNDLIGAHVFQLHHQSTQAIRSEEH